MDDYSSFELGLLLKKAGFDEACFMAYVKFNHGLKTLKYVDCPTNSDLNHLWCNTEFCSAPTHQSVLKWLRDKYKILVYIDYDGMTDNYCWATTDLVSGDPRPYDGIADSYYDAVENAVKYIVKNVIPKDIEWAEKQR
jgi:hypothetical protein